jgi:hypothetical protein
MNPKFALPVDTTEKRLRTVVATAPISLFAFDYTGLITVSEGKALEHLGLKRGQLMRDVSGRTKWWPGRHVFILYSSSPPEEIDARFVSSAGACWRGQTGTRVLIAFACRVAHPCLTACRQERTAVAYEPQSRRQCVFWLGMDCLSDGHIDFPNER